MSNSESQSLTRNEISRTAEEFIIAHGEAAYERASQEVSDLIANGDFAEAGAWQLVKEQILRRQETRSYLEALDRSVMLSE